MLEHAHRRNAIEGPVAHVSVVLQADLDLFLQPRCLYPLASRSCLLLAQSYSNYVCAVPPRCVDGKTAPSATDIEDPLSSPIGQAQLPADEIML